MNSDSLATGVLLIAIGLWLIFRTVTHDSNHQNLVDRLLAFG